MSHRNSLMNLGIAQGLEKASEGIIGGFEKRRKRKEDEERLSKDLSEKRAEFFAKYGISQDTISEGESLSKLRASGKTGAPSPSPSAMGQADETLKEYEGYKGRIAKQQERKGQFAPQRSIMDKTVSELQSVAEHYALRKKAGETLEPYEDEHLFDVQKRIAELTGTSKNFPKTKPEKPAPERGIGGRVWDAMWNKGSQSKPKNNPLGL